MKPQEFKEKWLAHLVGGWADLDADELAKSPLQEKTKLFLKDGFPDSAAPFLDFGWQSNGGKFENIFDCYAKYGYELDFETKKYWILGYDGEGNPICFDISKNDEIVVLDHEIEFELFHVINSSIEELAACLLCYRDFIEKIQADFGEEAFIERKFTIAYLEALKNEFLEINPNIFLESSFWDSEIENLGYELEN